MKEFLKEFKQLKNDTKRLILFMGWLTEKCIEQNISPPIIVGDSAIEIYTVGKYASGYIDIVSNRKDEIKQILIDTGIFREEGDFLVSEDLVLFVKISDSDLPEIYERVRKITISDKFEIHMIGIEDLIVDSLCEYALLKSQNDYLFAKYLLKKFKNQIDWEYLMVKAKKEKVEKTLKEMIKVDDYNENKFKET